MAHTPGPWGYVYDGSSIWSVGRDDDPQEARIAAVQKCSKGEYGWQEAGANAALIAAAPDLLAALKELKARCIILDECGPLVDAAIAKAEGR